MKLDFHLNLSETLNRVWILEYPETLNWVEQTQWHLYHCIDETLYWGLQDSLNTESSARAWTLVHRSKKFPHTMTPVTFTTVYTEFSKNGTNHGGKLSVRRGNPLGVLWVICWCGTWALKHPGALQQHRVTVTLSGFTVASASANRAALPLRRLHVETITEQTALRVSALIPD